MNIKAMELLKEKDLKNFFSICIGKAISNQIETNEFIGNFSKWNVDLKTGSLIIDDKNYSVQFIGTTSTQDNMWFSAEIEKEIPDEYVDLIIKIRAVLENNNLGEFAYKKIPVSNTLTGDMLSLMYCAFVPNGIGYFKGVSGSNSIYMFINNLPNYLFQKIPSNKFIPRVMEIINKYDVNAKLMVKSFLLNNDCELIDLNNSVIGIFSEELKITFNFDEKDSLINVSGQIN